MKAHLHKHKQEQEYNAKHGNCNNLLRQKGAPCPGFSQEKSSVLLSTLSQQVQFLSLKADGVVVTASGGMGFLTEQRAIALQGQTSPSKLLKSRRGLDSTETLICRVHANAYKTILISSIKAVLGSP